MAKNRKKPAPVEEPDDEAPGWHAIDAACERFYPDQTNPFHVASVPHPPFGDGLIYGISAYKAEKPSHWHFVTYGFSELYQKHWADPDVSGWGFELTFRLTRGKEKQPPNWAFDFLMNLGKYVRRSGNPLGVGHVMDLNGPIAWGTDTLIRAIAFTADSQFGAIDTPNGRVQFLQVVGLTFDEHEACGDWYTDAVLNVMREGNPLLVTDLGRPSILDKPKAAKRINDGIELEGSKSPCSFVAVVEWNALGGGKNRTATITLGARGVQSLLTKLRSRLAHDRDFALIGRDQTVGFEMGKRVALKARADVLTVTLTPEALAALRASLKPVRGRYEWPELPGVTLEVRPSEITDSAGNVIEVVG